MKIEQLGRAKLRLEELHPHYLERIPTITNDVVEDLDHADSYRELRAAVLYWATLATEREVALKDLITKHNL